MTVGERLAALRKARGLKKEDVAARAGISPGALYNYENPHTKREPKVRDLIALARSLQTTVAFLVGEIPDSSADALKSLQPRITLNYDSFLETVMNKAMQSDMKVYTLHDLVGPNESKLSEDFLQRVREVVSNLNDPTWGENGNAYNTEQRERLASLFRTGIEKHVNETVARL